MMNGTKCVFLGLIIKSEAHGAVESRIKIFDNLTAIFDDFDVISVDLLILTISSKEHVY